MKREIFTTIIKLYSILLLFYFLSLVFGIHINNDINMNPTLRAGDLVITYKLNKKYNRGDIVYINKRNNKSFVRVVGIEYDKIDIDENIVLINSYSEEREIYYETIKNDYSTFNYPYEIEKSEYFVLNDYRTNDNDSRSFGSVYKNNIEGVVIASIRIRDF